MSLKTRLESAFQAPSLRQRADLTARALSENSSKEIHPHFVDLIDQIFSNRNWGLFDTTRKNKDDFAALFNLLGPTGPLLDHINRLQADPFLRYALPKKLSNSNGEIDASGDSVKVSAFEYFCCRFAALVSEFELLHGSGFNTQNPDDHIYHSLLCCYLDYFLPIDGLFPVEKSSLLHTSMSTTSRSPSRSTSLLRRPLSISKATIERPQPGQTWRSETLLTILSERYLNHGHFCPNEDQIRALRSTIKHLHSSAANEIQFANDLHRETVDQSRIASEILSKYYEPRFSKLMTFCFEKWPLNSSFRPVYETWLTYIQPWRYQSDSKRLPAEIENIHSEWVQFVERNITCFTINLNDAMRRLLRTDLTRKENAHALYRVSWIFSQPNLMTLVLNTQMQPINDSYSTFNVDKSLNSSASKMEENSILAKELLRNTADARKNILKALEKNDGEEPWLVQYFTKFGIFGEFTKSSEEIEAEKVAKTLEDAGVQFANIFKLENEMSHFLRSSDTGSQFVADHVQTVFGPRLTELGRSQVLSGKYRLPVVFWCDPDFEEPIRSSEIAPAVPTLLRLASLTENSPLLTKFTVLPGFLGHLAKFALCHWNPVAKEWSTPRLKLRQIASYNVSFWLLFTLFISLISGAWFTGIKYYLLLTGLIFFTNFVAFRLKN